MRLPCEGCGELHIDEGEFATKPHHTHSCQHCGLTWRPCVLNTVGVRFLPGFKSDPVIGGPFVIWNTRDNCRVIGNFGTHETAKSYLLEHYYDHPHYQVRERESADAV